MSEAADILLDAARELSAELSELSFAAPVAFTYNPLQYAWAGYEAYVRKFVQGSVDVLYLGMNPGPFGMAQTGVPFGEIAAVSEWMGLHALVGAPAHTHPKRPIEGFGCTRSEVSGKRLWGLFAELYGSAENFFAHNFVSNYCPLIWMAASAANITPDKLPREQMQQVDAACRKHLLALIVALQPKILVGVGAYALKQFEAVKKLMPDYPCQTATILHPSPASPLANKQWPERPRAQVLEILAHAGLEMPRVC